MNFFSGCGGGGRSITRLSDYWNAAVGCVSLANVLDRAIFRVAIGVLVFHIFWFGRAYSDLVRDECWECVIISRNWCGVFSLGGVVFENTMYCSSCNSESLH